MQLVKSTRDTLLRPLQIVSGIVERRHTMPILANILIRKDGESVSFLSTDTEVQITTHANIGSGDDVTGTTVAARKLLDIMRALPESGDVTMTLANKRLAVQSGKSRFALQTLAAEEFPTVSVADTYNASVTLPQKTLKHLFNMVHFAMAQQDIRYYLNGLLLVLDGNKVIAVATDGHRLAQVDLPLPKGASGVPGVIVPRKTVGEVQRLIEDSEAEVGIELSQGKIRFTIGNVVLTSKLIDGTFPDYSRVIPTGNDKLLKLDPKSFYAGVDRVATIATEKTRAVKMALDRDKITLSVTSPENGTAAEEVPGEYTSMPFEIGFNSRYLMDILAQIDSDLVEVHLADAAAPTLIRENDKAPALYVLMPMRV